MARPREFDTDTAVRDALLVFWRKGYAATTMQDLEHATGLGRMSLYNAFGGKEDLFQAALERYIDATRKLYAKHLCGGGIADVERLVESYVLPIPLGKAGGWGCVMLGAINAADGVGTRARRAIERFRCFAIESIETELNGARERGEIAVAGNLHDIAEFIVTALWGAKAAMRHARSAAGAAPTGRVLVSFLRALRVPQPRPPIRRAGRPLRT